MSERNRERNRVFARVQVMDFAESRDVVQALHAKAPLGEPVPIPREHMLRVISALAYRADRAAGAVFPLEAETAC